MVVSGQLPNTSVSRVCSTLMSSAIVTSIVFLGNGAATIAQNYDYMKPVVSHNNEETNIYTSFLNKPSIYVNMPGYSNNDNINAGIETLIISDEKLDNLKKIETIASLTDNWNENGARAFSKTLMDKVRNLVMLLEFQPEIFPTACDSLQLEYDKADGAHMEIELTEDKSAEIFYVSSAGDENIRNIEASAERINEAVREFYG